MAIDLTSEATTYRSIQDHIGHEIVAVMYGGGVSVAIECETCGCVLLSAENEEIEE